MSGASIIETRGLGKRYQLGQPASRRTAWYKRVFRQSGCAAKSGEDHIWALKDVDLTIAAGERVAIIGRNGAGKSTLLKILSRVALPTEGEARLRGRVTSLLEVGTGFNNNLTGRENVYLNAAFHGVGREEIDGRMTEIVDFAEIGRFVDMSVKFYSSGMRSRLAFAVAAHLEPDILMLDEVLSVGDMGFQQKCLERMRGLTGGDRTLLFVSHSMDAVHRFCDRAIWLDGGEVRADGEVAEVTAAYVETVLSVRAKHEEKPPAQANGQAAVPPGAQEERPAANAHAPEALAPASDAKAVLLDAKIVDEHGVPSSVVTAEKAIGIVFRFEAFASGTYVPAIALNAPDGTLVFRSVPGWVDVERYRLSKGVYEAKVELPPAILNIGIYTISIIVCDPHYAPMVRYIRAEHVLSFQTVDGPEGYAQESDGMRTRGVMPRSFGGPLRPRLDWSLEPTIAMSGERTRACCSLS